MTYAEALRYLESFIDYEKISSYKYRDAVNLNRVEALLDGLGNPQRNFKSIHIAGTKGKGSTCAFVYSILKESGRKTGLYTSPHLIDFKERIRISFPKERGIEEYEVAVLVARIKSFLDKFTKASKFGSPTFFEVYTALAFLFFSIKKVDIAVVEVGMGGRLDATNVVTPLVAGITPISFDHTDKLGPTLEAIAKEKCGIVKNNCVVVASEQSSVVMNCIRKAAIDKNARLYEAGKDIFYEPLTADPEGQTFHVRGIFGDYTLLTTPLLGRHQIVNAACAIGIIEALRSKDILICSHNITSGIRNVNWPGRVQVVGRRPWIILDGAQNEASAKALRSSFAFPARRSGTRTRTFTYRSPRCALEPSCGTPSPRSRSMLPCWVPGRTVTSTVRPSRVGREISAPSAACAIEIGTAQYRLAPSRSKYSWRWTRTTT